MRTDRAVHVLIGGLRGQIWLTQLRDAAKLAPELVAGYVLGKCWGAEGISRPVDLYASTTDAADAVKTWLAANDKPPLPRTPLTKEAILIWANQQFERIEVAARPILGDATQNSVHRVLAELVVADDYRGIADLDKDGLVKIILNLYRNGTKGYYGQTEAELLAELDRRFISNAASQIVDLEGLTELGLT